VEEEILVLDPSEAPEVVDDFEIGTEAVLEVKDRPENQHKLQRRAAVQGGGGGEVRGVLSLSQSHTLHREAVTVTNLEVLEVKHRLCACHSHNIHTIISTGCGLYCVGTWWRGAVDEDPDPRPGKKLLVLDIDYTLFDHRSTAENPQGTHAPMYVQHYIYSHCLHCHHVHCQYSTLYLCALSPGYTCCHLRV